MSPVRNYIWLFKRFVWFGGSGLLLSWWQLCWSQGTCDSAHSSGCGNVSFRSFLYILICHSTFIIINIFAQEAFDLLPFFLSNSWLFKLLLTPKNESWNIKADTYFSRVKTYLYCVRYFFFFVNIMFSKLNSFLQSAKAKKITVLKLLKPMIKVIQSKDVPYNKLTAYQSP